MDNKKLSTNALWSLFETILVKIVSFSLTIILARLISPNSYGLVAIASIFIDFFSIFLDLGFNAVLIQDKNSNEKDFSSVFYFNIIISIIFFILLNIFSESIAIFYSNEKIKILINILSIALLITPFRNIQYIYASKNMQFKKFFYSSLFGTLLSAIVSVILALNGFEEFALISQTVLDVFIDAIISWFVIKWRPTEKLSFSNISRLIKLGFPLFLSSSIETLYNSLRRTAIGKIYTVDDLSFYSKGSQYPGSIVTTFISSIDNVVFPYSSNNIEELHNIKEIIRKTISISCYVVFPLMAGLISCSSLLISVLYTEKWLPSKPYLVVTCIIASILPLQKYNITAIKTIGRNDILFKIECLKIIISILMLLLTIKQGIMSITIGYLFVYIIEYIILSSVNYKLINFGIIQQLKTICPQLMASIIMGVIVISIKFPINSIVLLTIKIIVGIICYIIFSKIFMLNNYNYIKDIILKIIKKNEKKI